MQNTFPIFQTGQVLSSNQLNGVVSYLEEQDRLSRNRLIGIGIVCGLLVDFPDDENLLSISAGVAITSQGYLIVQEESQFSQYRPYVLPVSNLDEMPPDFTPPNEYPFFLNANSEPIPLWEMLPPDYVPSSSEPAPTPINSQFLADKVVLLFQEIVQSSLRQCDLNDCSDNGAQQVFTVRTLLVNKTDAQAMLDMEKAIAGRPVDLHDHPKYTLSPLNLEKINPAGENIASFSALVLRIGNVFNGKKEEVSQNLQQAYDAYAYLLNDIYPSDLYPNGPYNGPGAPLPTGNPLLILLIQHLYDWTFDIISSHNEFLTEASALETECCPNPLRFPQHILLGPVTNQPTAFAPPSPNTDYDPLSMNSPFGATVTPSSFRHHFIRSLLFDRQNEKIARVRSLHYRTFLLFYRISIDDLFDKPIKITPSRDGDVALSEKAIPFYYAFKKKDALHRNWSFDMTTRNWLEQVYAYQFTPKNPVSDHPLMNRLDSHNFYRVEGLVGKGLGETMRELVAQKQKLGLSFAIEPVYVKFGALSAGTSLDNRELERLKKALSKVLQCYVDDIDKTFLILILALFFLLYIIIVLIVRPKIGKVESLPRSSVAAQPVSTAQASLSDTVGVSSVDVTLLNELPKQQDADSTLNNIREQPYTKGWLTRTLNTPQDTEATTGDAYIAILDDDRGGTLYERTLRYARKMDSQSPPEEIASKILPTIALIDSTEDLIKTVGSASIADVDPQEFSDKFEGLRNAYQKYEDQVKTTDTQQYPNIAKMHELILDNFKQLESNGAATNVIATLGVYEKWKYSILMDLVLENYAQRHPGMEHKCGVPKGGTLVLLHTYRDSIPQILSETPPDTNTNLSLIYEQLGVSNIAELLKNPTVKLPQNKSGGPLDDFVVLADFCLPYLCCSTDCSDIVGNQNTTG